MTEPQEIHYMASVHDLFTPCGQKLAAVAYSQYLSRVNCDACKIEEFRKRDGELSRANDRHMQAITGLANAKQEEKAAAKQLVDAAARLTEIRNALSPEVRETLGKHPDKKV